MSIKISGSTIIDDSRNIINATQVGIATTTTSQPFQVGSGTTIVVVNNLGNLGIGTTNPTSKLTVVGNVLVSGVVTATSFSGDGSQLTGIVAGASAISISTNTTNQSQFIPYATSTGSVAGFGVTTGGLVFNPSTTRLGIGTINARANLDVTDSILISTGVAQTAGFLIKSYTQSNGAISFEDVNNTNPRFSIDRDTSYLFKINDTGFATKLIVANSGNLGVGTTNPTSKLHIIGDALITGISTVGLGDTSTPPNNSQMSFELTSNTNLRIKVRGTDGVLRSGNITLS